MRRAGFKGIAGLAMTLVFASVVAADVDVRVPFVRVQVGGGVRVRAPFVNLYFPSTPPPVVVMPAAEPAPATAAPRTEALPNPPKKTPVSKPTPQEEIKPDEPTPPVAGQQTVLTPEQFTKNFQPKAGNYEVIMLNPVSNQATTVRFTLPEGTPRRVNVSRNQIEFDYGPRQYVRIRFDREGVEVISR